MQYIILENYVVCLLFACLCASAVCMFMCFCCLYIYVFLLFACLCVSVVCMFMCFFCLHVYVSLLFACLCVSAVCMFMCFCCLYVYVLLLFACLCVSAVCMLMCFCCLYVYVLLLFACLCVSAVCMFMCLFCCMFNKHWLCVSTVFKLGTYQNWTESRLHWIDINVDDCFTFLSLHVNCLIYFRHLTFFFFQFIILHKGFKWWCNIPDN